MAEHQRGYVEGILWCVGVAREWAAFCRAKGQPRQAAACLSLARVFLTEADNEKTPPTGTIIMCPSCGAQRDSDEHKPVGGDESGESGE